MTAKIAGFGGSCLAQSEQEKGIVGSFAWSAPEYLDLKRIKERSEKGDIYSFGVILWELTTREIPWKQENYSNLDIVWIVMEGETLKIPENCPQELQEMMKQCWNNGLQFVNRNAYF